MIKRSVTQTKTWTWAASSSVEQDLLKDGYITHIDFMAEITPSATLAGSNQPDGPWRVIENLTIRGGSQTYFTLPASQGGRLWHFVMRKLLRSANFAGQAITDPNQAYHPILFRFHPGSRPTLPGGETNFFDLSAFIPAVEESSLKATWLTGLNSVMDSTVTISSGIMKATIYMVQGTPAEIMAEAKAQGVLALMTPSPTAEVYPASAIKSDYSDERDLPTGGFLRGIGILCQDATATRPQRAADQCIAIAVKMPGIGARLVEVDCEALWTAQDYAMFEVANDAVGLGAVHAPVGVFYLPLKDRGQSALGREYGINLLTARTGDWKLGMTVQTYTSGDSTLIWYDRLIPYVGTALSLAP